MIKFISVAIKFLLTALVIAGSSSKAHSQIDSSFRYYFYGQRYSLFEHLAEQKDAIVMLGNSITNGANWAELLQNPDVINRGISGDNTFGMLHRLHQITAIQPEKVFILIGINDLAKNNPVDLILNNYRNIVQTIMHESTGTRLYLQSLLPTNNQFNDFPHHQNKDAEIRALNKGIAQIAGDFNLIFIDLYPNFLDDEGRLSTLYTNDGLHLMGAGYARWAEIIRPYIQESTAPLKSFGGVYYERRKNLHHAMPERNNAVVMLGNSLTEQGLWNELFPGVPVLNRGVGGDNLRGMIERLPEILRHQPEKIFIMAGINNILFRNAQASPLADEMEEMINLIRKKNPDTQIFIQSLLPVDEFAANSRHLLSSKAETIMDYNFRLAKICDRHSIQFIDLFSSFSDENNYLKSKLTIDGIHLSPDGYKLWAALIKEFIMKY